MSFDTRSICCGDPALPLIFEEIWFCKILLIPRHVLLFERHHEGWLWGVSFLMLTGFLFGSSNSTDRLGRFVHSPELTDSSAEMMMFSMALMRNFVCLTARWLLSLSLTPQQAPKHCFVFVLCCGCSILCCHWCAIGLGASASPAVGGTEHVVVNGRRFAFFSSLVVLSLESDLFYQSLKARQHQNT